MAKVLEPLVIGGNQPADSTLHARPWHVAPKGVHADIVIAIGDGVYLSRHRVSDYERSADTQMEDDTEARRSKYTPHADEYAKLHIPEGTILKWAAIIDKARAMQGEAKARRSGQHSDRPTEAYEAKCHPGTDTRDPARDPSNIESQSDEWRLDRSESTILITISSGDHLLNASAVRHSHAIHVSLHTPDGRNYGDFTMSFDQFAAALVSHSSVPITWNSYWSCEPGNVMLQEVVRHPEPVKDRFVKRLEAAQATVKKLTQEALQTLRDQIATGKPMGKNALTEILRKLEGLPGTMGNHTQFIMTQAVEEVAHVTETAAIWIAMNHGILTPDAIAERTPLGSLLQGRRALAAPHPSAEPNR